MKYLIKQCAIMLLMSTIASTALKGMENPAKNMNNIITIQNKNNDDKSTLELRYVSEQRTRYGEESKPVHRSVTLNASFTLPLAISPDKNGLSSLTLFDHNGSNIERNRAKFVTIPAHDGDIITIQKKQNDTINIMSNGKLVHQFIY